MSYSARIGDPVPITATFIAGKDPSGKVVALALAADGTLSVSVSSTGTAIFDGVDSAIKATVRDYVGSNPLAVVLTDVSGNSYAASGGSSGAATPALNANALADTANRTALSSNSSRLGAMFVNRSAATFYLKAGAVASATSFTAILLPGQQGSLQDLFGCLYTGRIDAASDVNDPVSGAALYVSEFTA